MEQVYRGKHEKLKDWQERRYFGKHESWIPADDAHGYLRETTPVHRSYGPQKTLHVSEQDRRRRIITARQIFSFQDPGMVHRAIPVEGTVKPFGPIWEGAPQASFWLGKPKRRSLLHRMMGKK